jgi:AraC-like DNA-binding protein
MRPAMNTDTPLHTLDFVLRVGLVSLMLFVGAVVWRDQSRWPAGRLGTALALGVAAYALQSSAGFMNWPTLWRVPLAVLSTGNVVVLWLFARTVFDDDLRLRPLHGLAWFAMAALALGHRLPGAAPVVDVLIPLATLAFAALAVAQSVMSWRIDLVERRRRLRVFIVAAGALYTLVNMSLRLVPGPAADLWRGPVDLLVLSGIAAFASWRMLAAPGDLFAAPAVPSPIPLAPARPPVPSDNDAGSDPAQAELIAALERLMQSERIYREEGLTIARLAERLTVPEYKLRRTINQGLGHRNFNAFLNGYRLADAKAALADPAQAAVPVLTIALDAGFQSLGPFNRAFKADTGLTPTEFRKARGV